MWKSGDKLRYSWQLRQKKWVETCAKRSRRPGLVSFIHSLFSKKWANAHLVQDFFFKWGFYFSFLQKRNQSNDQQEKCILCNLVANWNTFIYICAKKNLNCFLLQLISDFLISFWLKWTSALERVALHISCGWVVRDFESKAKTRCNFQFR